MAIAVGVFVFPAFQWLSLRHFGLGVRRHVSMRKPHYGQNSAWISLSPVVCKALERQRLLAPVNGGDTAQY
jgi:hypothetical protein